MKDRFVLTSFVACGEPISVSKLRQVKNVIYAPLSSEGKIYTTDTSLWGDALDDRYDEDCYIPLEFLCKCQFEEVQNNKNSFWVLGLVQSAMVKAPGAEGTTASLVPLKKIYTKNSGIDFKSIGFDVVDLWNGISALNNFGFNQGDFSSIKKLGIVVNEYGLLSNLDANTFVKLVSELVPEHQPYSAVEVCIVRQSAYAG